VPSGGVARVSFPVRAAIASDSRSVQESFTLAVGGRPLPSAVATSTWQLHPFGRPTAAITAAPIYTLEDGGEPAATVQLSAADPSPGAGLERVEISSRAVCAGCAWTEPVRLAPSSFTARVALRGAGGHDLRVRSVDRAGNFGEWSPAKRVVVPRDDVASEVTFDGAWESASVAGSWMGSVHRSRRPGAMVETTADGSRFAVIGATGPDAAELEVWLDGVLSALVAPRSDATQHRQVLWEGNAPAGRHTLRVRVAGSPLADPTTGPTATVDALAIG
jgi:hypothetical protein